MENLTLDQLQNTSQNWDKRTKDLLITIEGSGNMWGGSSRLVHVTLHGDNSIKETGIITINGIAKLGYNISRGANGPSCSTMCYYSGVTNFDNLTANSKPTYKIEILETCGGSEAALSSILSAEIDWLTKN